MSSSTRFCSRLTSASCCSRFFFSSKSWLWIRSISSCSCCRAFSSIRALKKDNTDLWNLDHCLLVRSEKPERRGITMIPGHWGWYHFILWLQRWKSSSCSPIISCSQKKTWEKNHPSDSLLVQHKTITGTSHIQSIYITAYLFQNQPVCLWEDAFFSTNDTWSRVLLYLLIFF